MDPDNRRFKQTTAFVCQEYPERVCAERCSERQDEKVDHRQTERQDSPRRMPAPNQEAGADVCPTPRKRHNAHHGERRRRDARGKPNRSAIGAKEDCQRPRGEQQQREAHEHRKRTPKRTENGEDADVPFHQPQPRAGGLTSTRSSMRVERSWRTETEKWKQAPSSTPRGTVMCTW
jgi:hypothetical protein